MKNQDYVDRLPIGEVVSKKQVLAAMKKRGLIEDYSHFGYLEYKDAYHPLPNGDFEYMGSWFTTKYLSGCFNAYLVKCEPPYKYDAKTKTRRYSRMAARSYRYQFKHETCMDSLYTVASRLYWSMWSKKNYKLSKDIEQYRNRKMSAFQPLRTRKRDERYVNRSMSLGVFGGGVI